MLDPGVERVLGVLLFIVGSGTCLFAVARAARSLAAIAFLVSFLGGLALDGASTPQTVVLDSILFFVSLLLGLIAGRTALLWFNRQAAAGEGHGANIRQD